MAKNFRTGDQALVREYNRTILLNLLRVHAPLSRARLATVTGLNKTTVSSLIAELNAAGLVHEIGSTSPAAAGGRPATLLELNPNAGYIVGAELGVRYVAVVLADFTAKVVWRRQEALTEADDQQSMLDRLVRLAAEAIAVAKAAGQRVLGLGLGASGPVDNATGMLLFAPNLGWRDVPLRAVLAERLPIPVYVDNDAKTAALGEHYFGVAQQVDNFVFVIANAGIGAGVVLGGQVHRGASGLAGEVGHSTILPDGPLCSCGNHGCWEVLASQSALVGRIRRALEADGRTPLPAASATLTAGPMPEVVEAAGAGDALVLQALQETGVYLGIGIANLINSFNPSLVVLGGSLSLAADYLLPTIERTVAERAMPWSRQAASIVVSAFRFDACLMGGIALVLNELLSQPRLQGGPRASEFARPAAAAARQA